ncbi:putative effector related to avrK1 and avra10 (EKA) [Blumeria hordei DH14]|uniref:Putative effector related to avrK1 and avra10 (EKA) n=1 Tax=Blumeria graminis f. sp. hordei (strain DH14) TaxID=546991 RepID=N1JQL8_BLUG1|nr:putative effector related to avrK1 and avra10 (EKA) [Blumeria hordei DH14]
MYISTPLLLNSSEINSCIFTIPPVRKKRPNAKLDNTRVRPRALDQLHGLVQSPKCAEMSKVSIKGKEKALPAVAEPDTDMIGSVEIVEEIPQPPSVPHGIGESRKLPRKQSVPPELQPNIEAEQRLAVETPANLALRSAAFSRVEATLLPLTNRSNRQFVDSMRAYLRAAIAQYMATGPASRPPVLPTRPANPFPKAPNARSTPTPAVPALSIKSTWATAVLRPAAKAQKKETPKAEVDMRLFLRLETDHPWRKLSTSCVRMRIGFAMLANNEKSRQEILDGSSKLVSDNAKHETSSDLVALQIPNVPVTLFTWDNAPRPGFRILDEAGMATIHKPRPPIEQCKRCLGFHATLGYSPAPACWNHGSTMHLEAECKALTKCRNCGGPHRSDSRDCKVRPGKSGPVARAQAAAKKAEEAIIAAAKDISMAEATGFGALGSEEEI